MGRPGVTSKALRTEPLATIRPILELGWLPLPGRARPLCTAVPGLRTVGLICVRLPSMTPAATEVLCICPAQCRSPRVAGTQHVTGTTQKASFILILIDFNLNGRLWLS